MAGENVRERKKKRRFTLIFVPESESEQPRTFSISKWKLATALSTLFFGIVALVVLSLMYTPARSLLPVSNSEVEQLYGKQIAAIQNQVSSLYQELTTLRSYNLQLRKALGEEISPKDSNLVESSRTGESNEQKEEIGEGKISSLSDKKVYSDIIQHSQSKFSDLTAYAQEQSGGNTTAIVFPLTLPVNGYVSRGFDAKDFHYGIDFVSKTSSPILSAADGTIMFAGWTYDDGLMMIIAHSFGYVTVYKHNEALIKNSGASVKRGEMIALLGNTGKTSSGPHLHFEIWKDGIPYDPANYLLTTQ